MTIPGKPTSRLQKDRQDMNFVDSFDWLEYPADVAGEDFSRFRDKIKGF